MKHVLKGLCYTVRGNITLYISDRRPVKLKGSQSGSTFASMALFASSIFRACLQKVQSTEARPHGCSCPQLVCVPRDSAGRVSSTSAGMASAPLEHVPVHKGNRHDHLQVPAQLLCVHVCMYMHMHCFLIFTACSPRQCGLFPRQCGSRSNPYTYTYIYTCIVLYHLISR